jgi:NAD(P)-dependent dehydrogenase (short-subunit alcohol dehydrogenase family)
MEIEGKTILITGANRGIGQALVTEALRRGANRVQIARCPHQHRRDRAV